MASIAAACRVSARATAHTVRTHGANRAFRTLAAARAAQSFNMPALSPTMTEGNIATWRVKEGDSFSAGDVLLEIETDKAQMDVEAQDDGILAKIIQGDGSKSVQVGTRIAVTAEPGDDLSSLEIPAEESPAPKQTEAAKEAAKEPSSVPKEERHASVDSTASSSARSAAPSSGARPQKQKYPLYPSVQHLLKQNGLPKEEAEQIPATGPNGRLLKGDVLAYMGHIKENAAADLAKRIAKLGHLDLSNIKMAAPKEAAPKKEAKVAETAAPVVEAEVEIALPVSLQAVLQCQERFEETFGAVLPITTFIERATKLANENLPKSASAKPSADELFNAVLGLEKGAAQPSRGDYIPRFKAMVPVQPRKQVRAQKSDILDLLSGKKPAPRAVAPQPSPYLNPTVPNLFTVSVPKGDERRGRVFLQRLKSILETGPGQLVA